MARILLPVVLLGLITFLGPGFVRAQNNRPQITFGEILTGKGRILGVSNAQSKAEKVKLLLKTIEENGRKSKVAFYGNMPTPKSENSLTDNVAGYFVTPVPTLNPKLEEILAAANNLALPQTVPASIGQADLAPPKSSYTIALLGDSMTETLGEDLTQLKSLLKHEYPKTNFVLVNYGQGATTIEQGLKRLTAPSKYQNRDYPPLLHLQPDIIVVESFAYNHWSSGVNDLNRQWLTAVNILDTIKNYSKDINVLLLATISPNPEIFGDGKLNWNKNQKWDSVITTKAYLQNFLGFADSSGLPLADAYNPSLNANGHGDPRYISGTDHLHPSEEGKYLIAQKIVETIKYNNLLK